MLEVSIMINNQLKTLSDAVIDYETCSIDYQSPPPAPPKTSIVDKKEKNPLMFSLKRTKYMAVIHF